MVFLGCNVCHPRGMSDCTPEVPVSPRCCRGSLTDNPRAHFSCLMYSAYTVVPGVLGPWADVLRGHSSASGDSCRDPSSAQGGPCLLRWSLEALSSAWLFSSKTFYLLEVRGNLSGNFFFIASCVQYLASSSQAIIFQ